MTLPALFTISSALVLALTAPAGVVAQDLSEAASVAKILAGPDFELLALDHERYRLADARGKLLLVNFWATWCISCRSEIPELNELYNDTRESATTLSSRPVWWSMNPITDYSARHGCLTGARSWLRRCRWRASITRCGFTIRFAPMSGTCMRWTHRLHRRLEVTTVDRFTVPMVSWWYPSCRKG